MRHFDKIPADDALPAAAKACCALVQLYTFRMSWLNGEMSGEGACLSSLPDSQFTIHIHFDDRGIGQRNATGDSTHLSEKPSIVYMASLSLAAKHRHGLLGRCERHRKGLHSTLC